MKILKRALSATPLVWPFRPNGLYVFNYHRIGDSALSDFDPNVFSCTSARFENQLVFFKNSFTVISEDELLTIFDSEKTYNDKFALITFDDGYIDNYELAYPLLLKHKLPASFFIATDFILNNVIPWWDEIAFIIKACNPNHIKLTSIKEEFNLTNVPIDYKIKEVLRQFKQSKKPSMDEKIAELRDALGYYDKIETNQPLFMNWQQMLEMKANGMTFGSQTCSHSILSHLSNEQQEFEIKNSKLKLETKLNTTISSIAYPVGTIDSYNQTTLKLTKHYGYKIGFSFISGINQTANNQFEFRRLPVGNNVSISQLKQQINRIILG